ncbi:hypothetical protein N7493_003514 [Penicillium malachiteum]|uniref:Uncharacterized protein n=1 Tax=Penicillium malachiteum TaxID=1324776 RepID=A0AAD6MXP3_9EURO|nr:hypothetical protein N7493_003514 [Penicillium malachiteum]
MFGQLILISNSLAVSGDRSWASSFPIPRWICFPAGLTTAIAIYLTYTIPIHADRGFTQLTFACGAPHFLADLPLAILVLAHQQSSSFWWNHTLARRVDLAIVPLERGGSEKKLFDREQLLLITNATPGALLRRPSTSFSGHSEGLRSPASLQATHADSGGVPVMINLRTAFWRR